MNRKVFAAVAVAISLLTACGSSAKTGSSASLDSPGSATAGGTNQTSERPNRIVSLSPSATEDLFAIGAGSQVIAVDSLSNYPAQAPRTDLSSFNPNVEAIAKFNPDLVIVAWDTNGLSGNLKKLGIRTYLATAPSSIDAAYNQIRELGQQVGQQHNADALATSMKTKITNIVAKNQPTRTLKIYHEVDKTYYSADSTSFIGQVYAQFRVQNIADAAGNKATGYPQLSAEKIVTAAPDAIFLADSQAGGQTPKVIAARPGWSNIPAIKNGAVFALNEDIASRWGPRLVDLVQMIGDDLTRAAG